MKTLNAVIITFSFIFISLAGLSASAQAEESGFAVEEPFTAADLNNMAPASGGEKQHSLDDVLGVPMADKWSMGLNIRQDEMYFEKEQDALRYRDDGQSSVLVGIGLKYKF